MEDELKKETSIERINREMKDKTIETSRDKKAKDAKHKIKKKGKHNKSKKKDKKNTSTTSTASTRSIDKSVDEDMKSSLAKDARKKSINISAGLPVTMKGEPSLTTAAAFNQSRELTPTQKTAQIILYSDSVSEDFCGFYICAGVSGADGQLADWQKDMPFSSQTKSVLYPPYDTVIVSHGQNVYVVGGMQSKGAKNFYVSNQIFKYQLSNEKLQTVSNLRSPRVQHSCVVAGDRMYVIFGCKKINVPVNTIECIHLMSSKKLELKSEILKLPSYGRFGQSATYFRNRLWIIGGIAKIDNNFHLLSEIWILDVPKDNQWIKSKFPVPIAFAGICSVNEEFIYVVGGRCVGLNGKLQPSEKVWCYSTTTKRWQQIASLNQPRCNCCCVLLENRIYTFGGSLENDAEHLRGQTAEFYELNSPKQGWKMINKNLPCSISGQAVVVLSNF